MANALLGRGNYADAVTHFRGEIDRNRAEAMPYLAAVHQIMDDKNPGLAAKFATQMQKAGLTEEAERKPQIKHAPASGIVAGGTGNDALTGGSGEDTVKPRSGSNGTPDQTNGGQQVADAEDLLMLPLLLGAGAVIGGAVGQQGKPKPEVTQPQSPPSYPNIPPAPPPTGTPPSVSQPKPIEANGSGAPASDPQRPSILIFPQPEGNPGGNVLENRKGSPSTQEHIGKVKDEFLDAHPGSQHIGGGPLPEYHVPGPGKNLPALGEGDGRPRGGFTDLTFKMPDGSYTHIQTVDVDPRTGKPTVRELDNAERIRKLLERNQARHQIILVPKPGKARQDR
ncbi:MAG: hypothetical protein ACM3Q1_15155 [Bacteroidales bacterium]